MANLIPAKYRYIIFAALAIVIVACETEVDLIAEGEEKMVVVALLDPDSTVQRLKINKTFISEEDATVLAQDPANYTYEPGDITIILEGYLNGQLRKSWTQVNRKIYSKEGTGENNSNGIFSTSNNVIYELITDTVTGLLNADYTYVLKITDHTNGDEVVSAETEVINGAGKNIITSPSSVNLGFANGKGQYYDETIEWTAPDDARRFEVTMVMMFREVDVFSPTDTSAIQEVEMYIGEEKTAERTIERNSNAPQKVSTIYNGESFYRNLNEIFSKRDPKRVLIEGFYFRFVAGGEELNTYFEVNLPSEGIVQEKPEYTNVTNGLGIVSTRRIFRTGTYFLEPNFSVKELLEGKYTLGSGLIFCHIQKNTDPVSYQCR